MLYAERHESYNKQSVQYSLVLILIVRHFAYLLYHRSKQVFFPPVVPVPCYCAYLVV